MLWAVDQDRMDGSLVLDFPYFERTEPILWDEPGTYVSTESEFANTRSAEWNHGLGEILSAVWRRSDDHRLRGASQRALAGDCRTWWPATTASSGCPTDRTGMAVDVHAAGGQARLNAPPRPAVLAATRGVVRLGQLGAHLRAVSGPARSRLRPASR